MPQFWILLEAGKRRLGKMNKYKHIGEDLAMQMGGIIRQNLNHTYRPGYDFIPVTNASISQDDLMNAIDVLMGGWLVGGEAQSQFENHLCRYVGSKKALLVNSGSSANLLAIATLCSSSLGERALKPGDEVITVAAGFPTTVNPIVQYGCIPVFVDIDLRTGNIDPDAIESAISSKTKAIMLAHTLGNPFAITTIRDLVKQYDLWFIEDNCDALGSRYKNSSTGTFGHLSTLSFFPAHHITTGEGGALLVNDLRLFRIAESIRNWGRDCWCKPGQDNACGNRFGQQHGAMPRCYDHKYIYTEIGYNLKMTDMQAAIGSSQLMRIDEFVRIRRRNHQLLYRMLHPLSDVLLLPEESPETEVSWFGFLITILDPNTNRQELINYLQRKKIGSRLLFAGNLTNQPGYSQVKYRIAGNLNKTDLVMNNSFWIGVWPGLGLEQIEYMAKSILEYFKVEATY